ncbi:MAG: hypothetical protein N5P05_001054 [Chroococcopsis gigantea SAG 12.99]|nr:hypothetical protein [Chroococcopsis gigantea SAG 12.99]
MKIKNPFPLKQRAIEEHLKKATFKQPIGENIKERAKELENLGVKAIDALHVACFEASRSDYFITCDKRLLNRCQSLEISALNPIDFIRALNNEN